MMRRVPSIDRIRETIGWQPKTDLDETLRIIIRHYSEQLGGQSGALDRPA
jgi:nucleoside-diphosphate-sugar epimerase